MVGALKSKHGCSLRKRVCKACAGRFETPALLLLLLLLLFCFAFASRRPRNPTRCASARALAAWTVSPCVWALPAHGVWAAASHMRAAASLCQRSARLVYLRYSKYGVLSSCIWQSAVAELDFARRELERSRRQCEKLKLRVDVVTGRAQSSGSPAPITQRRLPAWVWLCTPAAPRITRCEPPWPWLPSSPTKCRLTDYPRHNSTIRMPGRRLHKTTAAILARKGCSLLAA